jgi:tight adherence protein C
MPTIVIGAAAAVAAALPLLWWSLAGARAPRHSAAANLTRGLGTTDLRDLVLAQAARERAVKPALARLAAMARRLTPRGMLTNLDHKLVLAGRPPAWPAERVLAAKLLVAGGALLLGLLVVAAMPGKWAVILAGILVLVAYLLPDALLGISGSQRQAEIQQRLPDTLDQITVCVEAGLGFEAAMARSARSGHGPIADELVRTLQEMQIGATRAQALRALAGRTAVPELRRFVFAMLQAESHGLPLADVLRIQAAELRLRRRQSAEERALKIPVKIIFPVALCMLPALLIIVMGPAGLRMAEFFSGSGLG